jgi:hypothetical protein
MNFGISDCFYLFDNSKVKFVKLCEKFATFKKNKRLMDKLQIDVMFLITRTSAEAQLNYIVWFCVNVLHVLDDIMILQKSDFTDSVSLSVFQLELQSLQQQLANKLVGNNSNRGACNSYLVKLAKFAKEVETLDSYLKYCAQQLTDSLLQLNEHVNIISLEHEKEELCVFVGSTHSRIVSRKLLNTDITLSKADVYNQLLLESRTYNESTPGTSLQLLLLQIDEKERDLQDCHNLAVRRHDVALQTLQCERESILRNKAKSLNSTANKECTKMAEYTTNNASTTMSQLILDFDELCDSSVLPDFDEDTFESACDEELPGADRCGVNYHGYNDWTEVDIWHQKQLKTKQLYDSFVSKFRRVRQLRIDVDDPNDHSDVDNDEYYADMEWWNDHIVYMKNRPDYEPYIAATRDNDAVAFHPQLGPWTGPYKELTDSTMVSQYSLLYEKDFEELELTRKELEHSKKQSKLNLRPLYCSDNRFSLHHCKFMFDTHFVVVLLSALTKKDTHGSAKQKITDAFLIILKT